MIFSTAQRPFDYRGVHGSYRCAQRVNICVAALDESQIITAHSPGSTARLYCTRHCAFHNCLLFSS